MQSSSSTQFNHNYLPWSSVNEEIPANQKSTPSETHVNKEIHKNSFFALATIPKTKFILNALFPAELPYDKLITKFSKDFLEGYEVRDKDGIYCINKEIVEKQSGLLKEVIVQLTKGITKGGSMSLSLPIRIFEPRTMLERITDWYVFAPIILTKAINTNDKIEAFKHCICFALSALFRSSQQLKPFNPMLGETFQVYWEDGTKMYLEHTCHIPPVSHFYLSGAKKEYTVSGHLEMAMEGMIKSVLTNSMRLIPRGHTTIKLTSTGQIIHYQFPKITLGGVVFGERYIVFSGHMRFEDRENGLKAVIRMNHSKRDSKGKRAHDFYGEIFHYDYSKDKPVKVFFEESTPKNPFPKDNKKVISKITGSWLDVVCFDNKPYWNIRDSQAPQIYPEKNVLPSDVRYREDRQWLQMSWDNPEYQKLYEKYSQNWKLALEAQQRYERGIRNKLVHK
jgi:hypothetical protein